MKMKYHKDLSERNRKIREDFEQMRAIGKFSIDEIIWQISQNYHVRDNPDFPNLSYNTVRKIIYQLDHYSS